MTGLPPADLGPLERLLHTVVDRTIEVVLATVKETEARDHVARCLQDRFGAPASQSKLILELIRKEKM